MTRLRAFGFCLGLAFGGLGLVSAAGFSSSRLMIRFPVRVTAFGSLVGCGGAVGVADAFGLIVSVLRGSCTGGADP